MEEKKKVITGQKTNDGDDVAAEFTDLPMGLLIEQPFLEVRKGQTALCEAYLETLAKLAYDTGKGTENNTTRVIRFEYTMPDMDKDSVQLQDKTYTINAPLLALVPLPSFLMDEVTVSFPMEANVSTSDTSESQEETSISFFGVKENVIGKVSCDSTKSRQRGSSAKYDICARAEQKEPTEGMTKLTSLFASTIETGEK